MLYVCLLFACFGFCIFIHICWWRNQNLDFYIQLHKGHSKQTFFVHSAIHEWVHLNILSGILCCSVASGSWTSQLWFHNRTNIWWTYCCLILWGRVVVDCCFPWFPPDKCLFSLFRFSEFYLRPWHLMDS